MQECANAINQAQREIETRHDLKGSGSEIALDEVVLTVGSADDMKLPAVVDILAGQAGQQCVPSSPLPGGVRFTSASAARSGRRRAPRP